MGCECEKCGNEKSLICYNCSNECDLGEEKEQLKEMKKIYSELSIEELVGKLQNPDAYDSEAAEEVISRFKKMNEWKKEALAADKFIESIDSYKTKDDGPYYDWVNSKLHRNR